MLYIIIIIIIIKVMKSNLYWGDHQGYSQSVNVDVTMIKYTYSHYEIVCLECWFFRTCVLEYINQ